MAPPLSNCNQTHQKEKKERKTANMQKQRNHETTPFVVSYFKVV